MQIAELIPYGHENAIKRSTLVELTGFTDRDVRDAINKSEDLIINMMDGEGYFRPTPEEADLVKQWEKTFWARIKDEMMRVQKATHWRNNLM